jgi:methyl-accepting chemotaxis protein
MVSYMNVALGQVAEATGHLSVASMELSETASKLASGSEEQTNQTSQVSASMQHMTASVQEVAQNASKAASNARQSEGTAERGGEIVVKTIENLKRIADAVGKLRGVVNNLTQSSSRIGDMVKTINDVAGQTNLLALNAAIEAARAGEHGRGFAVVADEVRKLAERTTVLTREITDMVQGIQDATKEAVGEMEASIAEVEGGLKLGEEAGAALRGIVMGVKEVQGMVQQIALSVEEQSAAAEEISSSVEAIASISHQNAEGANEASRSSGALNELTGQLQQLVSRFRLDSSGQQHLLIGEVVGDERENPK